MASDRTALESDVARDRWSAFLEEFSSDHRSWLTTVERCSPLGTADVIVRELPLASITLHETTGGGAIHIAFAGESEAASGVDVPEPTALRLVGVPGRVPSLEIHQTNGRCTRLRFRDVPLPELLDGIAPGEADSLGSSS